MIESEKAVLLSIQPKWCELIASGKKTIEVRKTKPKLPTPFKCYIHQTKRTWFYNIYSQIADWQGKVIGEFVCDRIECFSVPYPAFQGKMRQDILETSCLIYEQLHRYARGDALYAWHISDLKIYDKPKELCEFSKPNICRRGRQKHQCIGCWDCEIKRPPQSWCYVERLEGEQ